MFGKKGQKKRHPYLGIAMFSLAAAGVVSLYNKGKSFVKDKIGGVMGLKKSTRD